MFLSGFIFFYFKFIANVAEILQPNWGVEVKFQCEKVIMLKGKVNVKLKDFMKSFWYARQI